MKTGTVYHVPIHCLSTVGNSNRVRRSIGISVRWQHWKLNNSNSKKSSGPALATMMDISDTELLREVMNTIGKKDRLGGQVRCVVSVAMLTEGWDANTVTHILGIRAFSTQLLCEQVVGRSLRRFSYDLDDNLFTGGVCRHHGYPL